MTRAWLLLAACGGGSADPVTGALSPVPTDPAAALESCETIAFPEMALPCRVEAAARAASAGNVPLAEEACGRNPEGTWRAECHFRVGEELARRGDAIVALSQCVQAGHYARFCLTHAGWGLPPIPDQDSRLPPETILPRLQDLLGQVDGVLAGAPDGLEGEGRDIFRSRAWYNLYLGTGMADPAPARLAPVDQAPFARGAFALEAVRLLAPAGVPVPGDLVARVAAVWDGSLSPPSGTPLHARARHGRYNSPIPVPEELAATRIPTYGGGLRLVGGSVEEDLLIATLEALYFRADTPADVFLPWVTDPRERVRWTAARLLRLCPPDALDMEATLQDLLRSPDPAVRWNARDALDHKTWIRNPGGYR